MPGVFGVYDASGSKERLESLAKNMISAMNPEKRFRIDFKIEDNYFLGRTSLGVFNAMDQPINNEKNQTSLIFHGELYNNPGKLSDPEYLLELYHQKGDDFLHDVNGIFHLAICDRRANQLKLCSDKFGLQPLYYAIVKNALIFAGEVKALLQEKSLSREIDYQSLGDFFHYGQILGNKTLFKQIKLLAPGSILSYDLKSNSLSENKYWHLENLFVKNGKYNAILPTEDVVESLMRSIQARSKQQEDLGISLSGGLDSRGILAGLQDRARDLYSYTLGLSGCADQKLTEKMAQIAQTRHDFIEIKNTHLENFESMALQMIRLSDGMYHPHESTEMVALDYFKHAPFKILLRGHGGEMAKAALAYPVMVKPAVYKLNRGDQVLDYIFNITNLVLRDIDPARLFTPGLHRQMKDAAMQSLIESCANVSEKLAPADVCLYYYINEHIRRQVVASLEIFRSQIEIRLPYVDEEFLKLLLQLPVSHRNAGEIHVALIKKCMPALIKIPNSNTGALLDASPMQLFLSDKLHSIMKRLSILGFRHYTEFQDWYRKAFKDAIQKILLDKITKQRGLFQTNGLETVLDAHLSGKNNYAHFLGTAVGIELWFREFVD